MSVVKNLRASDLDGKFVTLRHDAGKEYHIRISEKLANDLKALGDIDIWERKNRYGTCKINIVGKVDGKIYTLNGYNLITSVSVSNVEFVQKNGMLVELTENILGKSKFLGKVVDTCWQLTYYIWCRKRRNQISVKHM